MHEPPKYVVKALKKVHEYCKLNECDLCPYVYKKKSYPFKDCLFTHGPEEIIWKKWIDQQESR